MKRGTIILVRFPFTDYSSSKLRPAVIISANNERDNCVAFISSVVPSILEETDYLITTRDQNFYATGLKKDSVFKMQKIATIDNTLVVGKLGEASPELQEKIDQKLKKALGLK